MNPIRTPQAPCGMKKLDNATEFGGYPTSSPHLPRSFEALQNSADKGVAFCTDTLEPDICKGDDRCTTENMIACLVCRRRQVVAHFYPRAVSS